MLRSLGARIPRPTKTPVPLGLCRWCSDDPNDVQRPLRVRVKTLVSPTGSSPANPSIPAGAHCPACASASSSGAFASQAHGTGPHARALAWSTFTTERRIPAGPVCRPLAARLCLRHQAVRPNWSLERTSTGKALGPRGGQAYHPPRGPSALPVVSAQLKR
jgi:hypothetical protein